MTRLFREPLLHFLLIGAAIYAAYGWLADPAPEPDDRRITVTAGEQLWMRDSWQKRWNRPPTEQELNGLIQQYIKETVLYREALTMGLNQHDPVIRRRLAQKLEFLAKDLATLAQPGDDELRAYFDQHLERYSEPLRYSFTQIYLDPDQRGDATLEDADRLKAQLTAAEAPGAAPIDVSMLGDRFMLPNQFSQQDDFQIARQFGRGFTDSLIELEPGKWHGPVLSGYGTHLVFVETIIEPPPPDFAAQRERVRVDWETDRGEALNQQFYDQLRSRYSVTIEPVKSPESTTAAPQTATTSAEGTPLASLAVKQ